MATLFVDKIDPQSGTSLEIGSSGDTITIPSGATITNNGTQTGFGGTNTPYFYVYLNSAQTVSDNTSTKIAFDTEVYDTGNDFEFIADSKYSEISSLLKFMRSYPDVIFSRLTGSGSCIYSAFEKKDSAERALLIFKERFPDHWSSIVENNFPNSTASGRPT